MHIPIKTPATSVKSSGYMGTDKFAGDAGKVPGILRITGSEVMKRLKAEAWRNDRHDQAYDRRTASFYSVFITQYRHNGTKKEHFMVVWYTGNPSHRWDSKLVDTLNEAVVLANKVKPESDRVTADELGESPIGKLAASVAPKASKMVFTMKETSTEENGGRMSRAANAIRVAHRYLEASAKHLICFDFDDTLVSSQGFVSVKKADGKALSMGSATFAHYKPSAGDELDFGAFNDVINPRIIKKNFDHLKKSLKKKDTKVVILTARSKGAESSVTQFLESLGIKGVQVVGLASSNPEDKATWIDQAIKDNDAKQMDFYDDSSANAAAVAAHGERHRANGVKFNSHNTPHPHEKDYDGPTIKTHFKSTDPRDAKVKYQPKPGAENPKEDSRKPSKMDWWDDQTDVFQRKYCDDHPASSYCGAHKMASDSLAKKIMDRAKRSGNKKVIDYIQSDFAEKMTQAGQHSGAWMDSLESSFDEFRRKPEGLFKNFKSKDFDDLYEALFGVDATKSKSASVTKIADTYILDSLLACLRAAHQVHWTAHWTTEGANFFSDHELFNKLYSSIPGEIDGLAEKITSMYGAASVNLPDQMVVMAKYITKWVKDHPNLVDRSYTVETDIQAAIKTTRDALGADGSLSIGLDNFLQGIADSHDNHLYLLKQRMKAANSRLGSVSVTYRKTQDGEWVAFGPASAIRVGPIVVTKKGRHSQKGKRDSCWTPLYG